MSFERARLHDDMAPANLARPESVAVMFADLDNFTCICLENPPEFIFLLIDQFQRIVREAIAEFEGTLNWFQGDGVLATFSEAAGKPDCATRSLGCAQAIAVQIRALAPRLRRFGEPPSVSVGLEYGDVWSYATDMSERFGPTLIGDAINVATKLEQRARGLSATIVAGDRLIQKSRRDAGADHPSLSRFVSRQPLFISGRKAPVDVWAMDRLDAAASPAPPRSLWANNEKKPPVVRAGRPVVRGGKIGDKQVIANPV